MSVLGEHEAPYQALEMSLSSSTLTPHCPNHLNCREPSFTDNYTTMAANMTEVTPTGNVSNITDMACYYMAESDDVVLSYKFLAYTSLIFVIIGMVGNFFSILVFTSREMRSMSSNVYLLMLALSDTFYLLVVCMTKTLSTLRCMYFADVAMDIFNRSAIWCKLLQYLLDLFSDYSTCLILAFTIERYVAVYLPIKFKEVCTVRRARISCVSIFLVIAVAISPYHIMYMEWYGGFNICTILLEHEETFVICYVVEVFIFRIIPVIVIAVLNGFIIYKVTKVTEMKRKKKALVQKNTGNNNKKKRSNKQDKSFQLTIMLILVSTSYIITYMPVLVHFIIWKLERSEIIVVSSGAMSIAKNYTSALYISGFAINFFLYTMSGRVFREQLELMLCDANRKDSRNGHTTYTEVPAEKTSLV